jgi:hypothetical protein
MREFGETMSIKQTIDFFLKFFREDVLYLLEVIAHCTISFSRRRKKTIYKNSDLFPREKYTRQ